MKALWVLTAAACLTVGTATAQTNQQQNPDPRERAQENAQEKASGIKDDIDIVSGPTIENVKRNSAWLTWKTNKTAATRVRYGTEPVEPSQVAYIPGGSTEHRVELKNLRPREPSITMRLRPATARIVLRAASTHRGSSRGDGACGTGGHFSCPSTLY